MIWRILLGIGAVGAVLLVVTPTGRYLLHGAANQAKILTRREPITRVVGDTTVPRATREKLRLVLDARQFAIDALGLRAKESFTTYTQLDSDTLVLVLSVAYRDSLAIKTWWWPVVGRVPYQGFFDVNAAKRAQAQYEREGFDTELRPSAAYSTLGWFNDPVLSTTLRADSARLVETVIHELLHNTVWIKGDAGFNESFATFVGVHGALRFFRDRGDSVSGARLTRGKESSRVIARFYNRLYHELDTAFTANPGPTARARRIALRDSLFAAARGRLAHEVAPAIGVRDTTWAQRFQLNIATLLAYRVYREDVDAYDSLLVRFGGDLRRAIVEIGEIARRAPKGGALRALEGAR